MNRILFERDEPHALERGDSRFNHIATVLKSRPGDTLLTGIVDGPKGTATIQEMSSDRIVLSCEFDRPEEPGPAELTCMLGHPRPIVLKRILKDLTTVGVNTIIVTGTELGEKSYLSSNLWRPSGMRRFLVDGASQAGFTRLPVVQREYTVRRAIDRAISDTPDADLLLLDTQPDAVPLDRWNANSPRVIYACGSERGWSENERELFAAAGFQAASMGPRILRTETAAVAGGLFLALKAAAVAARNGSI